MAEEEEEAEGQSWTMSLAKNSWGKRIGLKYSDGNLTCRGHATQLCNGLFHLSFNDLTHTHILHMVIETQHKL